MEQQPGSGSDPNNQPGFLLTGEEEIQHLISQQQQQQQQQESTSTSFTALLELPPTQAMELLLHSQDPNRAGHGHVPVHFNASTLTFPTNPALIERAAKFSVFAEQQHSYKKSSSPETSNSCANQQKTAVKAEPVESSDLMAENAVDAGGSEQRLSAKRKGREKKVKGAGTKKSKSSQNDAGEDGEKLPYVHVRARRGQATDNHSLAERARREKINTRMKLLQELVPGCNKISGTALILDEIINHVQYLQCQVELLSMRLAAVNPRIDTNLDSILAAESGSLVDSSIISTITPLIWPDIQADGSREQYHQQWHFDIAHQPVWGGEEDNNNFVTPEQSLLSYDSSANSASLHSNQINMKL